MMGDVKLFFSSLSPLLQLSPFKKKKKGSFCSAIASFALGTFFKVQLSLRGVSAVQLL